MCIFTPNNSSCGRCHDPIRVVVERCLPSRTGSCTTLRKLALDTGRGWLCSKCKKGAVEFVLWKLETMEINLDQEQESFDANSLRMLPEERHRVATALNTMRNACRSDRAVYNRMSAVLAWQEMANEANDLLHEENRTLSAEEQAFLVLSYGRNVLHSSVAVETALRGFEALRLMRDILAPGWRMQFATYGGSLGTPDELEYWEARNQIWREQRTRDILDSGVTDDFRLAEDLETVVAQVISKAMFDVACRAVDMLRMRGCARRFESRRERKVRAWNMGW